MLFANMSVSESTASESLHRPCAAVRRRFEENWLRLPHAKELVAIERHCATLGFPGCIGCVDVASFGHVIIALSDGRDNILGKIGNQAIV